jgi:Prolipoprotein diacylglyceryl transferase
MSLILREAFNGKLDKLVRADLPVLRRSLSAFHVCGVMGLGLALLLTMILAMYLGLSLLVIAGLAVVAVMVFLGLVMATKLITGEEKIIYYHHEIALMIMAALFLWLTHQPILPYLDITILGIGTFLFCGRVGCLMVGCCHGRPYRLGVRYRPEHAEAGFTPYLVGVRLFPIQAVESLWVFCIVAIGIIFILQSWPPGTALSWYVVAYDTGRFSFEFFRGDPDRPYLWGFSEAQWISAVLVWFVVWAEIPRALPFQWWHIVVTAGLTLAMIAITFKRKFQKTPRHELLHPRQVREIAEALRLLNSTGEKTQRLSGWTVFPRSNIATTVHLTCTSLGVQISAGKVRNVEGDICHYTFSCRNGGMTGETARILADVVLQLEPANVKGDLVKGNQDVFHLLVRPASEKRPGC